MTAARTSRRTFLGLAAGQPLGPLAYLPVALLALLSPVEPAVPLQPRGATGTASMWALTGQPNEQIRKDSVDAFNKLGKGTIKVTFFQNDPYKAKIRTAVGAAEAPTLIFGWGGGILKSYADAGHVDDLTSWLNENAALKDKFIPATWSAATIDDKIYAVPIQNTQLIILYHKKTLFERPAPSPPPPGMTS